MHVVRCKNKHFFDGDTYPKCPHCGAPAVDESTGRPSSADKPKRSGFFGRKSREKREAADGVTRVPEVVPVPAELQKQAAAPTVPQPIPQQGKAPSPQPMPQQGKAPVPRTMPQQGVVPQAQPILFQGQVAAGVQGQNIPPQPQNPEPVPQPASRPDWFPNPLSAGRNPEASGRPDQQPDQNIVQNRTAGQNQGFPASSSDSSLRDALRRASAMSASETLSFFSAETEQKPEPPAQPSPASGKDPVVGWIVCVRGELFGESFQIGAGANPIGRYEEVNRIVLSGDESVSREKHAVLTYEPRSRQFFLKPGDSSGLTYLNGAFLAESTELHAMDRIDLGEGSYIFVPLCGGTFSWDKYI